MHTPDVSQPLAVHNSRGTTIFPDATCSGARANIERVWPPNHKKVTVSIHGVTNPDGDPVFIRIDRVMQDEPTQGACDGSGRPDAARHRHADRAPALEEETIKQRGRLGHHNFQHA